MSEKITVYQKPTCSKCKATLRMLQEEGKDFETVNYYEAPLTVEALRSLLNKLGLSATDILRQDEPIALELGIGTKSFSEEELIVLMVRHPDLMQRPIVVRGERALVCRPPEKVRALF